MLHCGNGAQLFVSPRAGADSKRALFWGDTGPSGHTSVASGILRRQLPPASGFASSESCRRSRAVAQQRKGEKTNKSLHGETSNLGASDPWLTLLMYPTSG